MGGLDQWDSIKTAEHKEVRKQKDRKKGFSDGLKAFLNPLGRSTIDGAFGSVDVMEGPIRKEIP